MEHRCGCRAAVDYPALVLADGLSPVTATARNLAPGGIYLAGLSAPLRRHLAVEVLLLTPWAEVSRWCWPAMVLRSNGAEAALMFDRLRLGEFPQLLAALRSADIGRRFQPWHPAGRGAPRSGGLYPRIVQRAPRAAGGDGTLRLDHRAGAR